ncbi:phosphoribosylformylglycinamidine synthase [Candidatus Woesearchaeota archaeon]|nr:MAG: phosphoribosylformylglycinamidine synthase [Candidatus Woesearchaeota archaeon]
MSHRIEVGFKEGVTDAEGEAIKRRIEGELGIKKVESVKTIKVYIIGVDESVPRTTLEEIANKVLLDPIIQVSSVDHPIAHDFSWLIEIGKKPGVADPEGRTAETAVEDVLGRSIVPPDKGIFTSKQYLIKGDLSRSDAERIAAELLGNKMIEQWQIVDEAAYHSGFEMPLPIVRITDPPSVERINLNVSNVELLNLSRQRSVALNLKEMQTIRDYFLNPRVIEQRRIVGLDERITDCEIELLGQTWSEHCKHKIFNARINYDNGSGNTDVIDSLFNTYIKSSTSKLQEKLDWVVSTLWDNAGVIKFNDDWLLALKGETHNSPSAKDPFGGAITGIVGVYRDPMGTGMGAKIIYGTYAFCTGSPFYHGVLSPDIHPARLLEGVRKGVEAGGNKSGVPTPFGHLFFDDGFIGKPAIYVLAAGLIPAEVNGKPGWEKKADAGDLIVMCGGRIGIDGIHGATQSSMEMSDQISSEHVQIGDPFTQKKMHDFLLEARDLGLYKAITDNGAGGLSSSVGEMARMSGGLELHLDRAPLKYEGLKPWQILVSESQERMTLAVSQERINELTALARKHGVEISVLGNFTSSGKFHVLYKNRTVAYLDMSFVHEGVPQMNLKAVWKTPEQRGLFEPILFVVKNYGETIKKMLARENICSREYVARQFDHEVQGTSVIKPMVGKNSDVHSDAVVIRPLLGSDEGIAISSGINPHYGKIDTYHMAALALDEAIRRIIAVGGSLEQIAVNDNFCWPSPLIGENNPDAEYKLAQLVRANQALYDYTLAFGTPCVSGKDSMSMDALVKDKQGNKQRVSALPTIQFSAVGKIDDVTKCVTMDAKKQGDLVYVVGLTKNELGGSEIYDMIGEVGSNVPKVDAEKAKTIYNCMSEAVQMGLVHSIHGCYKGGLAVALAQTSFAGGLGMVVDLDKVPTESVFGNARILFSESASRFVVTVPKEKKEDFERVMGKVDYGCVGYITKKPVLKIKSVHGRTIIEEDIISLKQAWQEPFGT